MNVDYVQARERMVQEQLVSRGINDPQVLRAMAKIPRHLFLEKNCGTARTKIIHCPLRRTRQFRNLI